MVATSQDRDVLVFDAFSLWRGTADDPAYLSEARRFATLAHAGVLNADGTIGQRRKGSDEPYIVHPLAVAGLVSTSMHASKTSIAAALLHDTREDTRENPLNSRVTTAVIEYCFGAETASYVDQLSNMQTPADGDRATRKARVREKLASAPGAVQTVKVCDVLHNALSWAGAAYHGDTSDSRSSLAFARIRWFPEAWELLQVLDKADPALLKQALTVVRPWVGQGEEAVGEIHRGTRPK